MLEWKQGQISFIGDNPMQLAEANSSVTLTQDQKKTMTVLGETIRAYIHAARHLLAERYSHLRDLAPAHLADPGNVIAVTCPSGTVIRYEKRHETSKVITGWMPDDLPQVAAVMSQNLIQCHRTREYKTTVSSTGIELALFSVNPATNQKTDHMSFRIGFDVVLAPSYELASPPRKPFCLTSVRNSFEFNVLGEVVGEIEKIGEGKRFLSRTTLRLPVGWECIEVFPYTSLDRWNPDYAEIWAENDVLAAVAARQFEETQYQSLDPNAGARKEYAALLHDFKALLDSEPEREESLQKFLRNHPVLLCPTKTKMWRNFPSETRSQISFFATQVRIISSSSWRNRHIRYFAMMGTPGTS